MKQIQNADTICHPPTIRRPFLAKGIPSVLTTLIMLVAAQATSPLTVPSALAEPDVHAMSPRDIKAFNQTVPANHPYHIRCVREVDIGSLVAGTTTCKTNRQWTRSDKIGNENAREIGDKMVSKFSNTN